MWSQKLVKIQQNISRINHLGRILRNSSNVATKQTSALADDFNDVDSFKPGKKIHGFDITDVQKISEFDVIAIRLKHENTRADYVHLFRNDSNNVFSINFRTTPRDSTGLPHILEHAVLCGSKLYPVRDPFFKMLNRSLATFMNAMTGSDYTLYPFSSQNYSDYRNLQKIYLDAVFRPNIKQFDFMQEGWRLENKDPNDANSEIIIKGVVYNEMKGAFSENESILAQKIQNSILPDHTYGVISGGDPFKIPNLTWENLKKFHEDHYHPSNARFYSYGNFPLAPTLEYLNNEYLANSTFKSPHTTEVPAQTRWTKPRKEHIQCRFENMKQPFEKQNTISISLAMGTITDPYETFLLQFISELLVRGPNAPFYKSLIEPNFSGGFSSSTGFDSQPRDSIFTIGLQGILTTDFDRVEKLFDETVENVVAKGFTPEHIESVLHRYELSMKHESSNFGINLLFGITAPWNHDTDVTKILKVNTLIGQLRESIEKDPDYLKKTVKRYFHNNTHRLVLTMSPDKEYEQKQAVLEAELILEKTKGLSDQDRKDIYDKGLKLMQDQQIVENNDVLPTLRLADINSDVERFTVEKMIIGKVPTQVNCTNTNGLTYFRGILNTTVLSPEQHLLLPLFCYVITKLGTDRLNYQEFDSLVNRKTGGLSMSVHTGESLYALHTYEPGILINSYCLPENLEDMWDIWLQLFNISRLTDVTRFEKLVKLYMTNLTQGIADSGHVYAMSAAGGLVSGTAYQRDLLTGLPHVTYMKRLVQTASYVAMLDEILNIAKIVFSKNYMRSALNILETSKAHNLRLYENFLRQIPGSKMTAMNKTTYSTSTVWSPPDATNCHHHVLNVPVHYCSKSILTVPYSNSEFAQLRVLSRLLFAKYLHPELRERQGAYGGGARVSSDGTFTFYSYRDPRNLETLDVFDRTAKWFGENVDKITTEQELLEAKLGVFQGVDAPVPPYRKGIAEFELGLTADVLQRHRAELMAVDKKGLQAVVEKYLSEDKPALRGKVIVGPKEIDTKRRSNELWTVFETEH